LDSTPSVIDVNLSWYTPFEVGHFMKLGQLNYFVPTPSKPENLMLFGEPGV